MSFNPCYVGLIILTVEMKAPFMVDKEFHLEMRSGEYDIVVGKSLVYV